MKLTTTHLVIGTAILVTILSVAAFNKFSIRKFEHSFFSKPIWYFSLAAVVFLLIGLTSFPANFHQISFKLVIATAMLLTSAVIIGGLVYLNCVATNVWFGIAGSVIQLPLLLATSVVAAPVLFIGGFIWVVGGAGHARPPEPKSYYQQQLDWYYDRMNPNGFHKKW